MKTYAGQKAVPTPPRLPIRPIAPTLKSSSTLWDIIINPVGYNGPNMNPVMQNPTESAMIDGVAQIYPTTKAAIVELMSTHSL